MISSAGGEGIVVRTYWVEHKITMIFHSTPRHLQFRAIECMIVWRHMYGNTFVAVGAVKGMPLGCHLNCDWFCKGLRTVKYEGIRSSYPNLTTWEMSHGRRYQADFQHAWLPPVSSHAFPFPRTSLLDYSYQSRGLTMGLGESLQISWCQQVFPTLQTSTTLELRDPRASGVMGRRQHGLLHRIKNLMLLIGLGCLEPPTSLGQ